MGVIILIILNSLLKFFGKKLKIHLLGIFTDRPDPDRHALDVDPDPDPTRSGSTTLPDCKG
jgi:hypothetical protein